MAQSGHPLVPIERIDEMGMPRTDKGAIQQIVRALIADGWILYSVDNGGGHSKVSNEKQAIEEIEASGVARLFVRMALPDRIERGWVFFVLGNSPEEVAADWTTNLTAVDTVTDGWF